MFIRDVTLNKAMVTMCTVLKGKYLSTYSANLYWGLFFIQITMPNTINRM